MSGYEEDKRYDCHGHGRAPYHEQLPKPRKTNGHTKHTQNKRPTNKKILQKSNLNFAFYFNFWITIVKWENEKLSPKIIRASGKTRSVNEKRGG